MAAVALLPLLLVFLLPAAAAEYMEYSCNATAAGNFTPGSGSAFEANLDRLISILPTNASSSLFATASLGSAATDSEVHGLALCRGDMTDRAACASCLTDAFTRLRRLCGATRDATFYRDLCTARYSGSDFLSRPDDNDPVIDGMVASNDSTYPGWDASNATSRGFFLSLVGTLFGQMATYGAYNSTRRFVTAVMYINAELPIVYGLAQCTPDLAPAQCWSCFQELAELNRRWYAGRQGGRILGVRCGFRYEGYQFYAGTPDVRIGDVPQQGDGGSASSGAAGTNNPNNNRRKKVLIVALAVSATAFCSIILCGLVSLFLRIRRRRRRQRHAEAYAEKSSKQLITHSRTSSRTEEALKLWRIEESGSEFTLYDFADLEAATGGFSDANLLGRGGFGPVYRGELLSPSTSNGASATTTEVVAVKRLASHSGQGLQEFKNEIQLIARLQHTNLVRLLGCCVQGEREKVLVYEYLPNRSLDGFIFDRRRGAELDWEKRMRVVEGVAQGLLYLHKHSRVRVVHRDLKASNILLDKDLNPKISDFGMARIFGSNMTEANTNRVVGTYGYMAPEYASEGIFSVKSDVYSFGVLLLEILSGKRNSGHYGDFVNLLGYAWQLWKDGRAFELIDPTLAGDGVDVAAIMRCVKVALLCVQDNAADRPTMAEVTAMLQASGPEAVVPDPRRPPHFSLRLSSTTDEDGGWSEARTRSSHGTTSCSTNGLTITTIQEGR